MGQIRALAAKNWIIYRRNIFGSILEIAVPVGFLLEAAIMAVWLHWPPRVIH